MRTRHLRLFERGDGESGQGLIELIVALTLLAIAIGALLTVATSSALSLQRSDRKGTALMLAEQQIELYRNLTYNHIELDSNSISHTDALYQTGAHAADATIPLGTPGSEVVDGSPATFCTQVWPNATNWCNPSRVVPSSTSPDHRNYRVDTYIVTYTPTGGSGIKEVVVVVRDLQVSGDPILARASSTFSPVDAASGKAQPKLIVAAPAAGHTGDNLTPTATLSGASNPGGSISWFVLGPSATAPPSCVSGGTLTWTQVGTPVTVAGNAQYTASAAFSPVSAGTYWWYATYSGDSGNNSVNSGCDASMVQTVVTFTQSVPNIHVTTVPSTGTTNHAFTAGSISATLSNGNAPTGAINFWVSTTPNSQPSCPGGAWTLVGTATASGNGTYNPASAGFTPTQAGTYYWYASYAGDTNNTAVNSCNDAASTTTVGNETFNVTLNTASPWTTGTAFSLTVKAILGDGTTVDTSYTGSKTLVLSGPGAGPDGTHPFAYPSPVTFTNGQATFSATDYKAETAAVTVLDGTLGITGATGNFTVNTGPLAKFLVSNPGTQTVGTRFGITSVTATDAYGNVVTTYAGTKALTWSGASNSPNNTAPNYGAGATSVTFTNGVGAVPAGTGILLTNAASTNLTVTQGTTSGSTGSFTVNAGSAANLTLSMSSCAGATKKGRTWSFSVSRSVTDAYGNALSAAGLPQITVTPVVTGGLTVAPATLTIAAGATTTASTFTVTNPGSSGVAVSVKATAPGYTASSTCSYTTTP